MIRTMTRTGSAAAMAAAGWLAVAGIATAAELRFSTGSSSLPDAKAAGEQAARAAADGLKGAVPQVVVVFSARAQLTPGLVDGVGSVFDRALIHGCEGYAPLTADGNFADQGHAIKAGVAVLAIAGAEVVKMASAGTQGAGKWEESGRLIGEQLKPVMEGAGPGTLILTFGDQHVGQNGAFVKGLTGVLGGAVPLVGAAAGGSEAKEIVAGSITNGVNVAVLIRGAFDVQLACNGGQGDLVAKAGKSVSSVMENAGDRGRIVFVFDCGGRRGTLAKDGTLAGEFAAMKTAAGGLPLFGFYGGGEIGSVKAGEPSSGVGFSVATAAVLAK